MNDVTENMGNEIESFFGLLRYAIDEAAPKPEIRAGEWPKLFKMAQQQAIAGVLFAGVERYKKEGDCGTTEVPREIVLQWFALSEQIKQRNKVMNQRCVELTERLQSDGFLCRILKGQGNAIMYPNPYARTSGDIDIWVISKVENRNEVLGIGNEKSGDKIPKLEIVQYAKVQKPDTEVRYYHVEYEWKGVPVELHFMPGIMNNPWYNSRLQKWYQCHVDCLDITDLPDGVGKIPVPSWKFNVVFQLAHLMHHFFDEGIGLRQFIDYYYLLKMRNENQRSATEGKAKLEIRKEHEKLEMTLRHLGMYKFAGAVMYVMREVFHLEEQYMIAPVDERRGKTLLEEILRGGNFGHYSNLDQHSAAKKYFQKHWRNLHFVREYPAEALCEPVFRTWHFFWRMAHR